MSDPLARLIEQDRLRQQGAGAPGEQIQDTIGQVQSGDPLAQLIAQDRAGNAPAGQPGEQPGAQLGDLALGGAPQNFMEAQGREETFQEQRVKMLKGVLAKHPDLPEEHRKRVEKMIKENSAPTVFGVRVGNAAQDQDRSAFSNLARGGAHGLINYGILGASDLLLGAAQLALPKFLENKLGLPAVREHLHDAQAIVKDWIDPQGYAGSVGTIVGTFAGPSVAGRAAGLVGRGTRLGRYVETALNPFEVLNTAGMKALARVSPSAAGTVIRGLRPGASALERFSAHVMGSAAVDATQVADVLSNDQMTDREKMTAIAMTVLASGGAAAFASLKRTKGGEIPRDDNSIELTDGPAKDRVQQRVDEANALASGAKERAEEQAQRRRVDALAKAEWEVKNPNKKWSKDLTKSERQEIRKKYRDEHLPAKPEGGQQELALGEHPEQLDLLSQIQGDAEEIGKIRELVDKHFPELEETQKAALADGLAKGEEWAKNKVKELEENPDFKVVAPDEQPKGSREGLDLHNMLQTTIRDVENRQLKAGDGKILDDAEAAIANEWDKLNPDERRVIEGLYRKLHKMVISRSGAKVDSDATVDMFFYMLAGTEAKSKTSQMSEDQLRQQAKAVEDLREQLKRKASEGHSITAQEFGRRMENLGISREDAIRMAEDPTYVPEHLRPYTNLYKENTGGLRNLHGERVTLVGADEIRRWHDRLTPAERAKESGITIAWKDMSAGDRAYVMAYYDALRYSANHEQAKEFAKKVQEHQKKYNELQDEIDKKEDKLAKKYSEKDVHTFDPYDQQPQHAIQGKDRAALNDLYFRRDNIEKDLGPAPLAKDMDFSAERGEESNNHPQPLYDARDARSTSDALRDTINMLLHSKVKDARAMIEAALKEVDQDPTLQHSPEAKRILDRMQFGKRDPTDLRNELAWLDKVYNIQEFNKGVEHKAAAKDKVAYTPYELNIDESMKELLRAIGSEGALADVDDALNNLQNSMTPLEAIKQIREAFPMLSESDAHALVGDLFVDTEAATKFLRQHMIEQGGLEIYPETFQRWLSEDETPPEAKRILAMLKELPAQSIIPVLNDVLRAARSGESRPGISGRIIGVLKNSTEIEAYIQPMLMAAHEQARTDLTAAGGKLERPGKMVDISELHDRFDPGETLTLEMTIYNNDGEPIFHPGDIVDDDILEIIEEIGYTAIRVSSNKEGPAYNGPTTSREAPGPVELLHRKQGDIPDDIYNKMLDGLNAVEGHLFAGQDIPTADQVMWAKRAADYLGVDLVQTDRFPQPSAGEVEQARVQREAVDQQMVTDGKMPQEVLDAFKQVNNLGFESAKAASEAVLDEPNWRMIWDVAKFKSQADAIDQWREQYLLNHPNEPQSLDEAKRLIDRTNKELKSQVERRRDAERRADTDATTGVGSKDAMLRLKDQFDADPNLEWTIVDISNFKYPNDKYGFAAGDALLRNAADALRAGAESVGSSLRAFRQGDEFFLLHPPGEGKRITDIASKMFRQDIDGWTLDFHVGSGNKFDDANFALGEAKKNFIGPKYRVQEEVATEGKEKKKAGRKPKEVTDFYGIKVKGKLEDLTDKQRTKLHDKLVDALDEGKVSMEQFREAAKVLKQLESKPAVPTPEAEKPTVPETPEGLTKDQIDLDAVNEQNRLLKMDKANPRHIETADLIKYKQDLDRRLKIAGTPDERKALQARLNDVLEEAARRREDIGKLQVHPSVTGAVAGFAAGLMLPADDDQERMRNAFYLAAALGGAGALVRLKKRANAELPDYVKNIREHVRSVEDRPIDQREGSFTEQLRAYGNTLRKAGRRLAAGAARRDLGISQPSKLAGGYGLSAAKSAGKRAEIFGLWRGMADSWVRGDRIAYWNKDGVEVPLDAVPLSKIAQLAKGDTRAVGDLSAAHLELVLRNRDVPRTTGIGLEDARALYANAPEHIHQASQELHKFFRAMRDMSVASGLLSTESAQAMDAQSFYVAIRRILGTDVNQRSETIDVKGKKVSKTVAAPENLFKLLKGSKLPFQNPFEAAIDLVGRYMRANELNILATQFFDEVRTMPKEVAGRLVKKKLGETEIKALQHETLKLAALKRQLDDSGARMSPDEMRAALHAISDEWLSGTDDIVKVFRNGKMEAYQVHESVAKAFKALQPHEFSALMEAIRPVVKLTDIARVGITANPAFVGYQAFRDIFQFYMNGTYAPPASSGVVRKVASAPLQIADSALHSMMGYLGLMFNTEEARSYRLAGAGNESVAGQGLQTVRGSIRRSTDLLDVVKEGPSKTQFHRIGKELGQAVTQMSFRKLREAYASILSPLADAGRFGAYLKERGRGADVIEAIYRSKKAGANFSNRGDSVAMMAMNRMTLFLNPAIQGLDASRYAFQRDPIGYMVRGVVGVALPSLYLWAAYKDDKDIVQLRSTEYGKKYWWLRVNGEIVRVPKPLFEGQVFGSSVESWLDKNEQNDPLAMRNFRDALVNDATVNLLPFIGVVPVSLASGKIYGLGSSLIPPGREGVDIEYQGYPSSSVISRTVSRVAAPVARKVDIDAVSRAVTPAGIDFIIRQYLGGLGSEAAMLFSQVINKSSGGDWPAKDEMAFVRSVFGRSPSRGSAALLEFYTMADRTERAVGTVNLMATSDPDKLLGYVNDRQVPLSMNDFYAEGRKKILEWRKAYNDITEMPRDMISDKDRRELSDMALRAMIDVAIEYNKAARNLNASMKK